MSSIKDQSNDELNLKKTRPVAGEKRRFTTGEALFLSPLPVPTGNIPMDLGGSFVDVNDTTLDVGSSNFGKAFQARSMIGLGMMFILSCLIVLPLLAGSTTWGNPFSESFWDRAGSMFDLGVIFSFWGGGAAALLGAYVILSTTRKKSRTRPIRFNRQRREVCFFPEGSDTPVVQPWEETVSWLSISTGVTGVGVTSTYTFGMAFDDPSADLVHFVNQGLMTPAHGLGKWEAIRVYMEKGPQFCPGIAPYEGRNTFDQLRKTIKEEYREGERSAISVGWWYLSQLITWWRFPYWIAEWDHRYSMKALPDSIAEWSKPLSPEQWAKPSSALIEQSAKIENSFAQGKDFMTYFKTNLSVNESDE